MTKNEMKALLEKIYKMWEDGEVVECSETIVALHGKLLEEVKENEIHNGIYVD